MLDCWRLGSKVLEVSDLGFNLIEILDLDTYHLAFCGSWRDLLVLSVQFVASTVLGVVRNLFNRRRDDNDEFDD